MPWRRQPNFVDWDIRDSRLQRNRLSKAAIHGTEKPSAESGNAIIQAVWQQYSLHFEGTAVLPETRKNM